MTKEQALSEKLDISVLPNGVIDKIYQAMELFHSTSQHVGVLENKITVSAESKFNIIYYPKGRVNFIK